MLQTIFHSPSILRYAHCLDMPILNLVRHYWPFQGIREMSLELFNDEVFDEVQSL